MFTIQKLLLHLAISDAFATASGAQALSVPYGVSRDSGILVSLFQAAYLLLMFSANSACLRG